MGRDGRMVVCLSYKETDYGTGSYLFSRKASSLALEQKKAHRCKAAAAAEPRLVHPDKIADGGPQARSGSLQSGDRQQVARL